MEQSVTRGTGRAYESHWSSWVRFMREAMNDEDPYLRNWSEGDRSALVCLFLRRRYQDGLRGKQATAVTAGMRLEFSKALLPTGFLDSALLTAARTACRMSTAELRGKKDRGANPDVKTPLCESVLLGMRASLWEGKGWGRGDIDGRMVYLACMWGYDQTARVSEYTAPERNQEDHCIRAGDLTFELRGGQRLVGGEGLREREGLLGSQVEGCWVQASSHKTGSRVKAKLIGRRSAEEAQFLEDLVEWNVRAGVMAEDKLFTRYLGRGDGTFSRKYLTARMVRDQLKATAEVEGLDPAFISAHSLRKAAATHMRALGVTGDDMRDRGNYAAGSQVMGNTYDYSAAGHGPLSSNSLVAGGRRPDVGDVRRHFQGRPDLESARHLGSILGEGDRDPSLGPP